MSELHWTGAALLLALVVLGGRASRTDRGPELCRAEVAVRAVDTAGHPGAKGQEGA